MFPLYKMLDSFLREHSPSIFYFKIEITLEVKVNRVQIAKIPKMRFHSRLNVILCKQHLC